MTTASRTVSEPARKLLDRGRDVLAALEPLRKLGDSAPDAARGAAGNLARDMQRLQARLGGGRVEVGLFGLPKAGKSTLLNALAGKLVSAMDVLPETAFPIYLIPSTEAGADAKAKVYFHQALNRPPVELPPEELGRLTRDKSLWSPRDVAFAEVPSRTEVLGPGFCFIDTPGLEEFVADYGDSSDRLLNDESDAAILVATPDQAMRDAVRKFLELSTRRCPRLWIALNVDVNAMGLRPDGTRATLGTDEFPRLRTRFRERLGDVKGLELMVKEGSASIHLFSARAAMDRRFAGATLDELLSDPGTREFAELARAARAYADDPAREQHAVKFWTKRLREFSHEVAGTIDGSADKEQVKLDGLKTTLSQMEASRSEQVKLEQQLREVLDSGVTESGDAFRGITQEILGPFFATPLRQAVAGWHRSSESLRTLQANVKTALRSEFETARIRLRDAAKDRAVKLAGTMPGLAEGSPPEPAWIHPILEDEPPLALVGDLGQLPVWLGRVASFLFLVIAATIGGLIFNLLTVAFDNFAGLGLLILVVGTWGVGFVVRVWTRRELTTRNWSGWTKKFFLPGDQDHIRAMYEDHLRDFAKREIDAAQGWLQGFAAALLAKKVQPEPAELVATRKAVADQAPKVEVLRKTAVELRSRSQTE